MQILLPLLGTALLLLLLADVFLTVLESQGHGGPLNRVLSRGTWALFRRLGVARSGEVHAGVLAFGAPVIVVLTLAIWLLLLVAGFALVYLPWIGSFHVSPGSLRAPWAEALYYSGYSAATLGLGDLVAPTVWLRLLTVLEAFAGFALVSASITYLLAVYRELLAMRALASGIGGYVRANDLHSPGFPADGRTDAVARWGESVTDSLLKVLEAHYQYPILHYFRPRDESRALPLQLAELVRLRNRARGAAATEEVARLARHPSFRSLVDAVEQYLREVDEHFVPSSVPPAQGAQAAGDEAEQSLGRLLRYMRYA